VGACNPQQLETVSPCAYKRKLYTTSSSLMLYTHTYTYDSPEVLLDLNLPPDLFLHLVLQDLCLDQAFQGDDVPRRGLCPRQVDSTEFPTSEGFADLEI
jgi:hypothetical protein